jgi:hypothetical protein
MLAMTDVVLPLTRRARDADAAEELPPKPRIFRSALVMLTVVVGTVVVATVLVADEPEPSSSSQVTVRVGFEPKLFGFSRAAKVTLSEPESTSRSFGTPSRRCFAG